MHINCQQNGTMVSKKSINTQVSLHEIPLQSGTPPLLVKGRHDPSMRSKGHADSRYGIVAVGITRLHFTLSITRHGLESSTS